MASGSRKRTADSSRPKSTAEPTPKFVDQLSASHYRALVESEREIKPTKFACLESLNTLGVREGVTALFQNIGWGNFLNLWAPTYTSITRSVLASIVRHESDRNVEFQIFRTKYTLSYSDVNMVMGTPEEGTFLYDNEFHEEYNELGFWQSITGQNSYQAHRAKSSSIIHPCIRIAHRILCSTVFGRKEVGQITRVELYFLWCMTHGHGEIPDFSSLFFEKCVATRDSLDGDIYIGGLFTIIATSQLLSLAIPSPPYKLAPGPTRLDLAAFTRMQMIAERQGGGFTWFHATRNPYLVLPDPRIAQFNPLFAHTWIIPRFIPDDDEAPEPPQQMPQQQQQQHAPQPFPPQFFQQFDAMRLDIQYMRQRNDTMYDRIENMWDWHVQEGHFPHPPPDPPM